MVNIENAHNISDLAISETTYTALSHSEFEIGPDNFSRLEEIDVSQFPTVFMVGKDIPLQLSEPDAIRPAALGYRIRGEVLKEEGPVEAVLNIEMPGIFHKAISLVRGKRAPIKGRLTEYPTPGHLI
jgi:hypothetical protein